eukprot:4354028-Prymnesium_polylepis.1
MAPRSTSAARRAWRRHHASACAGAANGCTMRLRAQGSIGRETKSKGARTVPLSGARGASSNTAV